MNYAAHYDRLIARARARALTGYRERHHVLPRCMGGRDAPSNIVELTAEEHYVAHQLLVKMYPCEPKLVHAAWWMSTRCFSNKAYGWLRRRHAESASVTLRGLPKPESHRIKLAAYHTGRKLTPEAGAKIAAANRRRVFSPETRAKMAAAHRGIPKGPCSAETRAKISAAKRARASA